MKPGFSTKIRQEALPQRPATGLPCSGRLLHEPRAVLAGDCAYCTNPRTPRSTPTPRPVGPDPRALRPGEVRTPRERSRPSTSKPSAAHLLPRVRVSPIWRRGRDSNPRCARRTAVFKTATFGRSVTSPGRTHRARQAQTLPSRRARGHCEPAGPSPQVADGAVVPYASRSRGRGYDRAAYPTNARPGGPATSRPGRRPAAAPAPRPARRTRAGAACWRAPAAGSSARRAAPRPGPAQLSATPAGAP